jgi:hypothetical protein
MSGSQSGNKGGGSKAPGSKKGKQTTAPPLSGRYSRTEGAGTGPRREHSNPPPKRRKRK